jgi:hypothetical protein
MIVEHSVSIGRAIQKFVRWNAGWVHEEAPSGLAPEQEMMAIPSATVDVAQLRE